MLPARWRRIERRTVHAEAVPPVTQRGHGAPVELAALIQGALGMYQGGEESLAAGHGPILPTRSGGRSTRYCGT